MSSPRADSPSRSPSASPGAAGDVDSIAAPVDANGVVAATPLSLVGHIGHLTQEQTKMFEEFKASQAALHAETDAYLTGLDRARIAAKENGREATEAELAALREEREREWPYELARFLRANKWKLDDARKAYAGYLAWRKLKKVDTILDSLPFNGLLIDRAVGNNAAGFDKKGRPIYIEKSGSVLTDGLLTCFTDDDIIGSHLWQQENSVKRAAASSKQRREHIEMFTSIMDLNGLTSSTQRALKFTKMLSAIDSTYYPERLGDLYVINAPWIFPVIWAIVKGWIDPVTRAKIHIVKGDPKPTLLAHIDADQLPAEYGGTCNRCLNSPQCAKLFTIAEFAELLPLKIEDKNLVASLKKETVKAGKVLKVSLPLKAGEAGEWVWQQTGSDKDDIDFSVTFVPTPSAAAAPAVTEPIQVCLESRVQSQTVFLPQGSYLALSDGVLHVEWSNKFSWMSSKHVAYALRHLGEHRRPCLGDQKLAHKMALQASAGPVGAAAGGAGAAAAASS